jgi:ferric iron reductase protein FhuF
VASPAQVTSALAAAAAIGPFFALGTDAAGPGWHPATAFYRAGPDGFLARAAGRLAAAEPRVAASIAQQGYAARLWSPVLGCGLLRATVPDLTGLQIHNDVATAPLALALPPASGWLTRDLATLAALSYRVVAVAHLEPLARALSSQVAGGLLWGNAASALVGALEMLVRARPELREPATELAATLLATGRLRDTGKLGVTGAGAGFRRRSCCLYYRLPGGGLCGDCGLSLRPD